MCGVNVVALIVVVIIDRRRMNDDIEFIIFFIAMLSSAMTNLCFVFRLLLHVKCFILIQISFGGRLLLFRPASMNKLA